MSDIGEEFAGSTEDGYCVHGHDGDFGRRYARARLQQLNAPCPLTGRVQ